jgi:hypothetical protein
MSGDPSYERLLELGKQQGGLTTHDVQQVLDLESMSLNELSDMLIRLEGAGVSVELDPAIVWPRSGAAGTNRPSDISLPDRREPRFPPPGGRSSAPDSVPEKPKAAPAALPNQLGYSRDKTVQIAVGVALGIIVLVALLLAGTL